MRLSSIDYTLKRYIPERPGEYWISLARKVTEAMHTSGEGPEANKARAEKLAKEADARVEKLMDEYFLFLEEYRTKHRPEHEPDEQLRVFDLWLVQKIAGLQLVVEKIA